MKTIENAAGRKVLSEINGETCISIEPTNLFTINCVSFIYVVGEVAAGIAGIDAEVEIVAIAE